MISRILLASAVVLVGLQLPAASAAFESPLDVPALKSAIAARSPLDGLARAGDRLVAVGVRGHILLSGDAGASWEQMPVPVSSDLTAAYFPTPEQGWAVGHEGVVLHTGDGGRTWSKQLDGRQAATLIGVTYEARAKRGDPDASRVLEDARRMANDGPDKPFLDVWFQDDKTGFVVGAFNLILKTVDGGKTWEPWLDRIENPNGFHLYSIRGDADSVYIAGEQGLVLKLDPQAQRFVALPSTYRGTFFGVLTSPGAVLVFGLRGNAFVSSDGGRTWVKSQTGVETGLQGGTVLRDGRVLLVSQGGQVIVSADGGRSFQVANLPATSPLAAATPGKANAVVLIGSRGARVEALQ